MASKLESTNKESVVEQTLEDFKNAIALDNPVRTRDQMLEGKTEDELIDIISHAKEIESGFNDVEGNPDKNVEIYEAGSFIGIFSSGFRVEDGQIISWEAEAKIKQFVFDLCVDAGKKLSEIKKGKIDNQASRKQIEDMVES